MTAPVYDSTAWRSLTALAIGNALMSRAAVAPSVPCFLIDHVEQRLASREAAAVLQEYLLPLLAVGRAVDRDVRRDQDVRHRPERALGRQRLRGDDVEAGASELPRPQGCDQVLGDHDAATADIDEVRALLHAREQRGVKHADRVRRLRHGDEVEIGLTDAVRERGRRK